MTDIVELARRFPARFLFGTATAAYQIEGGHDADGKGPSIWDTFCRRPGAISTGETGDVACDHYNRWRDDVALMASLGCNAYRFSISWPRVIPDGVGRPNEAGLAFYERLVDELIAKNIRPFVTLYHWDLPLTLQDQGGWASREVVPAFAEYAKVVAARLGERVAGWMTLNEPEVVAFAGHYAGVHAPGIKEFPVAVTASHHLLLAHRAGAQAVRAAQPSARIGIALNMSHCEPATDSAADAEAAARMDGYLNRWFLDPLFGRGYPKDMVALYAPYFDRAHEMDGYDGRLDFVGVNFYTRRIVRASAEGPLRLDRVDPEGEHTAIGWEVHPESFRKVLVRVARDYGPREMYVTENGAAYDDQVVDDRVEDPRRVSFLFRHFAAAADAIADGVPLRGYFIWTLMDNFEWSHGTSKRFGIVHTDYATQRRRVKSSGKIYRELIRAHRRAHAPAAAPA